MMAESFVFDFLSAFGFVFVFGFAPVAAAFLFCPPEDFVEDVSAASVPGCSVYIKRAVETRG